MNNSAINAARSAKSYAAAAKRHSETDHEKNVALALGEIAAALEALGQQQQSQ